MHFSEWLSICVEQYVLNYAFKFWAPLSCRFSLRLQNILRRRKNMPFSLGWFLDMARKTPNQASRRRVNEMHNLRDVNGNPTRLSASMISTPRAKQSRTRPSSSSVNTTTVTATNTRLSTNLDTTPSFSDSSNEDLSLSRRHCAWHCVTWQKLTLRWPGTERSRMTTLVERFRTFSLS